MKRKLHRSITTLLVALLTLSCGQSFAVESVKAPNIRYAEVPPGVDANHLSLDVYAPKDAKNLPVMIYIHGGGWRTGDKRAVGAKPACFTARGSVFVSLNYQPLENSTAAPGNRNTSLQPETVSISGGDSRLVASTTRSEAVLLGGGALLLMVLDGLAWKKFAR